MLRIRNKPARITLKVLLCLCGFVFLLFAAVSIYIETNKKQILEKLRVNVNQNLRSEITYRDADITVWSSFPFVSVHFYDIKIEDSLYHMPFLQLKEMAGKVSVLQYFHNNIELRDLYLAGGMIHMFTDTGGYTNKYLMQPRKNGNQEKKKMLLNHTTLRDVRLVLENRQRNKLFDFDFKKLDAAISQAGDLWRVRLRNKAVIHSMAFNLEKGSYLKDHLIETNARILFDTKTATLSFDEEKFIVNGQPYFMKGQFMMRAPGYFKLAIRTESAPYSKLRGMFSRNIAEKLGYFEIDRPLDARATLEGPLAYKTVPRILASWEVRRSTLTAKGTRLADCSFTGSFTNEKVSGHGPTDQNSEIKLHKFKGNWEGIALSGKHIIVNDLVNPVIDLSMSSSTDLRVLNSKLGLKTIEFLQGKAALDLSYAGPLQKDISVVDKLTARLGFTNGRIRYVPRGFTFDNCRGNVLFSGNAVQVNGLECDLGKNHFVVNVTGSNVTALSAADAGRASIQCNIYSPSIDISAMKGLFSRKKTVAKTPSKRSSIFQTASKVDDIMDNGSLRVSLNAASVRYNAFTGRNLAGNIAFAGDDLLIDNISLAHANGSLTLQGAVRQNAYNNTATVKADLRNVDVQGLFRAFDNFGQDGIMAENLQGVLTALANIGLAFDANGKAIPGTIKGTVDFSLRNGALINYEPIMEIKKSVFKKADMSNVRFAELKDRLDIDGYHININKMEIQSSAIGMFVEGLYDIKKNDTKLSIQVPLKGLKQRDSTYIPENIGVDAKKGLSVYLEGKVDKKTGKVKIGLNTSKTLRKII